MSKQPVERANKGPRGAEQERRSRGYHDFADEYLGKEVAVHLSDGRTVRGRVVAVQRFWVKVASGAAVLYLNKAHVVSIEAT